MKIRQKLILGFLTVSMLVATVGYLSINASQKTLKEQISKAAEILASDLLKDIDRHIYNRIETFQEYCKDLITQQAVSKSNTQFEKLDDIQAYINKQDLAWSAAAENETTDFMQELLDNELSEELREKLDFYKEKYGYSVFAEAIVTNKYGANVAMSQKTSDFFQADEDWWRQAAEHGLYVGDVEYDMSAKTYAITLCIRIVDHTNRFLGVVKTVLSIEDTFAFLKDDTPVTLNLLNKDHRVIYSTNHHAFLEDLTKRTPYHDLLEHSDDSCTIAKTDTFGNNAALIAHVHSAGFKDFQGLGWTLMVEHDLKKVFASATKLKAWILLISGGITALSAILGLCLARSISVPITKLLHAVQSFGKGNLDTHVEIESNDETGQLAKAFNKMVEDLKTSTTSIDRLNSMNQQLEASRRQLEASNIQSQSEITERQRIEVSLKGVNEELEETVEKLAQSNQELQDFAYIASHDLREPLRKISSFGSLLNDSIRNSLEEDDKENLDFMIDGADRMAQMIEALLKYSRINTKKVLFETVDLNEILQQLQHLELATVAEETDSTIQIPQPLPNVKADSVQIRQLMQNLIANAIKYRHDEISPQIEITAKQISNREVRIEVKDNGIGIKQEFQSNIFKMFTRVHSKQKYEGTGIGLAVCRKIADRHGGRIGVNSKEGEGSVFWFTLPLATEPQLVS